MIIRKSRFRLYIQKLLLLILLLFSQSRGSWGNAVPYTTWMLLLLFCTAAFLLLSLKTIKKVNSLVFLAFLGFSFAAFFNNANLKNGSYYFESIFIICLLFMLTSHRNEDWIHFSVCAMLITTMVHPIATIAAYVSKPFYDSILFPLVSQWTETKYLYLANYYASGITHHYSTNGMYLALAASSALSMNVPVIGKKNKKDLTAAFSLIMMFGLLLTNKRAHILFTSAGAMVAYFYYYSNRPLKRFQKILGFGFIGVLVVYLLYNLMPSLFVFAERFVSDSEAGDVSNGRYKMWAFALAMLNSTNFLFGVGWGKIHLLTGNHTHNVYIQLLVETGIIGTIFVVSFMAYSLYCAIKSLTNSRKGLSIYEPTAERDLVASIIYQVFFLLYCITGTCLYEVQTIVPYFILSTIGIYYHINSSKYAA